MSRTVFSANEVVEIVNALRGAGVSKFKFRGLEIEFFGTNSWGETVVNTSDPATPAAESHLTTPVGVDAGLTEEDRLEQIKLTDPVEYERLLELKEIADGDTNDN